MTLYIRPILAILTVVAILGGLEGYFLLRDRFGPSTARVVERQAAGVFSLEVTLTFEAGPDAFALQAKDNACLEVWYRGESVLRREGSLKAGETVLASPVEKIVAGTDDFSGRNEFLIKATPAESRADMANAARVRLLRDDVPIAEQLLWSDSGGKVEGKLVAVVLESNEPHGLHGAPP